jgi:hypothetical protein
VPGVIPAAPAGATSLVTGLAQGFLAVFGVSRMIEYTFAL